MSAVADAVRLERVRIATVRSTYVVLGLALVLPAAIAALLGVNSDGALDVEQVVAGLTAGAGFFFLPLPAVLAGVLGVLTVGHDHEHGTARAVLTAVPRRSALLAGRLGVLAVTVAVTALVGLLANALALRLTAPAGYALDAAWAPLAGYLVLVVLWALLGAGLALLLRATTGPVVILLVVPLVIEPVLGALLSADRVHWLTPVARYLPFQAGRQLAVPEGSGFDPQALAPLQGGLVFAAFTAAVVALGWLAFERRDV